MAGGPGPPAKGHLALSLSCPVEIAQGGPSMVSGCLQESGSALCHFLSLFLFFFFKFIYFEREPDPGLELTNHETDLS